MALELVKHEGISALLSKDKNGNFAILQLGQEEQIRLITACMENEQGVECGLFNQVKSRARNTRKCQFQSECGKKLIEDTNCTTGGGDYKVPLV